MRKDKPRGWVDTAYLGYGIKKRVVGGPGGWKRVREYNRDGLRVSWLQGVGTPEYVRVLVFRHGIVVNRFLNMKRAKEWIRCQL